VAMPTSIRAKGMSLTDSVSTTGQRGPNPPQVEVADRGVQPIGDLNVPTRYVQSGAAFAWVTSKFHPLPLGNHWNEAGEMVKVPSL